MKKLSQLALAMCLLATPLSACTSTSQAQGNSTSDSEAKTSMAEATPTQEMSTPVDKKEVIKHIDAAFMRQNIFDYKENPNKFTFKGKRPAILDFYADWCPPCRRLSPKLAKLAEKYADKVDVYKVDVDNEAELARVFGVKSIPMLLFIPMEGTPIQTLGDLSEEELEQSIAKILQ